MCADGWFTLANRRRRNGPGGIEKRDGKPVELDPFVGVLCRAIFPRSNLSARGEDISFTSVFIYTKELS